MEQNKELVVDMQQISEVTESYFNQLRYEDSVNTIKESIKRAFSIADAEAKKNGKDIRYINYSFDDVVDDRPKFMGEARNLVKYILSLNPKKVYAGYNAETVLRMSKEYKHEGFANLSTNIGELGNAVVFKFPSDIIHTNELYLEIDDGSLAHILLKGVRFDVSKWIKD